MYDELGAEEGTRQHRSHSEGLMQEEAQCCCSQECLCMRCAHAALAEHEIAVLTVPYFQ
jgi:hypothetical protein